MLIKKLLFVKILLLVTVTTVRVYGDRDSLCQTPNGENATCLLITDCPMINEPFLANDKNKTIKAFVQQSLCGYEDYIPLVCCSRKFDVPLYRSDDFIEAYKKEKKEAMEDNIKSSSFSVKLPDASICGLERDQKNKVYKGEETRLDEFPWMAALEYRNKKSKTVTGILCGGSIINNQYVLTAAHCLIQKDIEVFQIRLGEWDTTSEKDCIDTTKTECADPILKVGIEKIIPHPYYNGRTKNDDIGLIKLNTTITYTDYIRPICLASINLPPLKPQTPVFVAGWGITENQTTSALKLKAELKLLKNQKCKEMRPAIDSHLSIGLNQICAGDEKGGKDSCRGDSGGPLMRAEGVDEAQLNGQIQWYQEGIVSWGFFCGASSVYTRVRRYRNWIISQLE